MFSCAKQTRNWASFWQGEQGAGMVNRKFRMLKKKTDGNVPGDEAESLVKIFVICCKWRKR